METRAKRPRGGLTRDRSAFENDDVVVDGINEAWAGDATPHRFTVTFGECGVLCGFCVCGPRCGEQSLRMDRHGLRPRCGPAFLHINCHTRIDADDAEADSTTMDEAARAAESLQRLVMFSSL